MGDLNWYDLVRFVLGVAALLLAALVLRLALLRYRRGDDRVHPATYASYAGALVLLALLRLSHIGEDPTWDLWVAVAVVCAGWYGVARRMTIPLVPARR